MQAGASVDAASVILGGLRDRESLEAHYVNTMASLMEAVEAKDQYTRGHTDRVRELSVTLARAAGVDEEEIRDIERAASLHDIGKIAVPDRIISKPGRLSPEELAVVRKHTERGGRILQHLRFLEAARLIVRSHHERYDGKGYPRGLRGEQIPLGARILAVADSYDAMTSARPYREAMSPADALREIEVNAGGQFDPALARVFVKMMRFRAPPAPRSAPGVLSSA